MADLGATGVGVAADVERKPTKTVKKKRESKKDNKEAKEHPPQTEEPRKEEPEEEAKEAKPKKEKPLKEPEEEAKEAKPKKEQPLKDAPEQEVTVNAKAKGGVTDSKVPSKKEEAESEDSGEGPLSLKAGISEGLAVFMFVIIGCGIACAHGASDAPSRLIVAFGFGIGILVLAYGFAHHSGAQINCAVTFALVLAGVESPKQGALNAAFQFLGSVLGACFLCILFPCEVDQTTSLGTNVINPLYGHAPALFGEFFGTFLLCYTVFEVVINPKSNVGNNYGLAISFSVFLAHLILLPITGCSINPTRSFGPAVVGSIRNCDGGIGTRGLEDLWLMFVGPFLGAAAAAGTKRLMH